MTSLEQAKEIVKVMDKMKAKDIRLINIHELSQSGRLFCDRLCQQYNSGEGNRRRD